MSNLFVNIAVQAPDSDRAKKFYDMLAGRPLEHKLGFGRTLPGIEQNGGPGQEISLLRVDCAVTATMKAWDLGAEVLQDVTRIPNSGWYSVIVDPAGAKVGLFQPTDGEGGKGDNI